MSITVNLAQDGIFEIMLLDVIQTFICWPSLLETIFISCILWMLRHIERLIGILSILTYFFIQMLCSLPFFCFVLSWKGFKKHYSFLYFVPYSLFVYMVWRIPSYHSAFIDKILPSILFSLIILLNFPFSIFNLIAAVLGYSFWINHSFRFQKCLRKLFSC